MNTKEYLNQARKFEFNSMQARSSNNNCTADRYESMAKMAMIDAANCYNNESTRNNSYNTKCHITNIEESPIHSIIGFSIGLSIIAICYLFMEMFL